MPIVYSAISEQTEHIYDVIARQFAHKILRDLNLLTNFGDKIYIDTGYTTPQNTSDENHNSVVRNNKLIVRAKPNTNPTSLKWDNLTGTHVTGQYIDYRSIHTQFPTIFADKAVDVFLREMCIPTYLTFEFELELVSRDQAYEIPAQLFRRFAAGQCFTETLTYDYPVPNDILTLIYSLYKMRRLATPKSFVEYVNICSNNKFQANRSRAKEQPKLEFVIPKTLINTVATLSYTEDKPEEVKNNRSANAYQIKFNVETQFERADMVCLQYPPVIDNQLLPGNMIPRPRTSMPMESLDGDHPLKVYNDQSKENAIIGISPIIMPYYDDWLIPHDKLKMNSYKEFLTAMFLIEENAPDNITEIGLSGDLGEGYQLHPIVKRILKLQKNESFRTDCIFNISVYVGQIRIDPSLLQLTDDLVVKVPCKTINKNHRIVLSEITDIKYLNPKWLSELYKDCPYFHLCKPIEDLINKGLLTINNGVIRDPKKNILGGTDDSYWPLRIIRADIIPRHEAERNRQNTAG